MFALQAGDLIFTGTPAGVGAINRGDKLHAAIEGVGTLDAEVI
jgi:fumarylpyruvate hydrolase